LIPQAGKAISCRTARTFGTCQLAAFSQTLPFSVSLKEAKIWGFAAFSQVRCLLSQLPLSPRRSPS
jgi:hypothetical protein